MRTYYEWLEIAENASPAVIRGAFKYLAQRWHPDKNPENPELARITLREINEAFKVLSDPQARERYDRWLRDQRVNHRRFDRRASDRKVGGAGDEGDITAPLERSTQQKGKGQGKGPSRLDIWV